MDMNVYQLNAKETAVYPTDYAIPAELVGLVYTTLGLAGEAGELANKVKKILRDDGGTLSKSRRTELLHELGDVLWYVSQVAIELDYGLAQVALANLHKLQVRKDSDSLGGSGDTR